MALIVCPECNRDMSDTLSACPHCGFVVKKESDEIAQTQKDEIKETKTDNTEKTKKIGIAIGICAVIIIAIIIGVASSQTLSGDDKIAYDILVEAAQSFKDPSSVRLVSGSLSLSGNRYSTLRCELSATNSFGARVTSFYNISNISGISVRETDFPDSDHKDKTSLNIDKINNALAKALNLD